MKTKKKWLLASALMAGLAGTAQADVITFENDSPGEKLNGFQSVESSGVSFSDTLDADLFLDNFGIESIGQSLSVVDDDASALLLNFSAPAENLSLTFGNDDPNLSNSGDLAVLTAFLSNVQVGQSTVVLNRNDAADQSIMFSGLFDAATFQYTTSNPTVPLDLIEVVDNVSFTPAATPAPVPEPGTMALMGVGLASLVAARRRKKEKPVA